MTERPIGSSYRDPSGYVFRQDGVLLRRVTNHYREEYDQLLTSGLYRRLTGLGLLVPHEEVEGAARTDGVPGDSTYKVLRPEEIPMISYPFEWAPGQLRDAALLTLRIQSEALEHGMVLKDASAYNVQFRNAAPIFIDTLSFERYVEGRPWAAYGQFCRHFLAPLMLMTRVDVRLGGLLRRHLDGIPLDLASLLLPKRTWLRPGSALHLHLHARSVLKHAGSTDRERLRRARLSRTGLDAISGSLARTVEGLAWEPDRRGWVTYEAEHTYSGAAREAKERAVFEYLRRLGAEVVWDLGANTGAFSRIAESAGARVVAFDADAGVIESLYRRERGRQGRIMPLVVDLGDPTPPLGWDLGEWEPLHQRDDPDVVLALALVHHLALGSNLPLDRIARGFARLARHAIVEWIPRDDPQAQRLMVAREDIFDRYERTEFERAFSRHFTVQTVAPLPDSARVLYLLARRSPPAGIGGGLMSHAGDHPPPS